MLKLQHFGLKTFLVLALASGITLCSEVHGVEEIIEYDHHIGNETLTQHELEALHHEPPYVILFLFGCCVCGGKKNDEVKASNFCLY